MSRVDQDLQLPRWAVTRWLVAVRGEVPDDIRPALVQGLYGSIPIFLGGVINTILISTIIGFRNPTAPFLIWAGLELILAIVRLPLLIIGRRAAKYGGRAFIDPYLLLAVAWAASVGYGTFITLLSGDWIASTLACLSAAAMVGGISFRNFGAPRLVAVMILLSLGPCMIGCLLSGEPILLVTAFQIPMYVFAMSAAAYRLNDMLVCTMKSERENRHLARHDALTGLFNRIGLEEAVDSRARRSGRERHATLFYLDLDGFKGVNDRLGHDAGDQLLAEVGQRLRGLVDRNDIVARIGGDEFVILSGHGDPASRLGAGQRIIDGVSVTPYLLGTEGVLIGVSVGIAMLPDHGDSFRSLMLAADKALYEAKAQGGQRSAIAWQAADGEGLLRPREAVERRRSASA